MIACITNLYEHDLANVCTEQPVRAHMIVPSANIRDIFYLDIGFQCTFEQLYKEYGEPETVLIACITNLYEHDLANVCTEQPVRAHMIAPV
jgi:hypothetical protein